MKLRNLLFKITYLPITVHTKFLVFLTKGQ
jgi:hypothetical protein